MIRKLVSATLLAACCCTVAAHAAGTRTAPAAKNVGAKAIDLWAFSASTALAPSRKVEEFRAQEGFQSEDTQALNGNLEAKDVKPYPRQVTLKYRDGLRIRVIDYGDQAFLGQVRVAGPSWPVHDGLKVGATRAEVEAVLGRPTRGGGTVATYQGETDTVRFNYAGNLVSAVEIDRGF